MKPAFPPPLTNRVSMREFFFTISGTESSCTGILSVVPYFPRPIIEGLFYALIYLVGAGNQILHRFDVLLHLSLIHI